MKFEKVNYEELKRENKEKYKLLKRDVEEFINSGDYCVNIIDDEKIYNNNNDLRNTLQQCIKRYDLSVKVFMLNGKVYLRRK